MIQDRQGLFESFAWGLRRYKELDRPQTHLQELSKLIILTLYGLEQDQWLCLLTDRGISINTKLS